MLLSKTFLTDSPIDNEYKQYCILAYQQKVNEEFQYQNLYPYLSTTIDHYTYVNDFLNNKINLEKSHSYVTGIDFKNNKVIYESKIQHDILGDFEELAEWSGRIFKSIIENGKMIYDLIEKQLHVDLVKKDKNEFGYALFLNKPSKLYHYTINNLNNQHWSINMEYLKDVKGKILTGVSTDQPLFHIEYPDYLSMEHAILPITKRIIVKKFIEDKKGIQ